MHPFYKYFFLLFSLLIFQSCQKKDKWSVEEKEAFYDLCFTGTIELYDTETAKKYCDCMLNTIIEKYPDPETVEAITMDEMNHYASECL